MKQCTTGSKLTGPKSVFGITEFTISADDWRFPVTMVAVCVPFFLLTFILQTRAGMRAVKKLGDFVEGNMGRWNDHSRSRHERRVQLQQQLVQAAEQQQQAPSLAAGRRRRISLGKVKGGGNLAGLNGVVVEPMGVIDGLAVPQADKWWGWRRKRAEDMLGKPASSDV